MSDAPRRGWAENVGGGIRRDHRTGCPRTRDRKRNARCECPWSWWRPVLYRDQRQRSGPFYGTLSEARAEKRRQETTANDTRRQVGRLRASYGSATFQSYYARWLRFGVEKWSPVTVEHRERSYRKHMHETFGALPIGDITPQLVEDWVASLRERAVGQQAIFLTFASLHAVLGVAAKKRHIPWNPASAVEWPKRKPKGATKDWLTPDEYRLLVTACATPMELVLVRLSAEAGLRRGEIAGLRADRIDLAAREIVIDNAVVSVRGTGLVDRPPKSGHTRYAAITAALRDALATYLAAENITGDQRLFTHPKHPDRPVDPESITEAVQAVMVRAGLTKPNDATKAALTLHDMRRTAATLAYDRGVPMGVIRDQLGHGEKVITKEHYVRSRTNPRLGEFADALDGLSQESVEGGDAG